MRAMNSTGGYVRLFRSLSEWEWYHDDRCVRLFIHLLIKSNWSEGRWKGQPVAPGQIITSSVKLAEQLGWNRSAVVRTLDKLKLSGEVDTKTDNHWTLITLANWEKYQGEEEKVNSKAVNRRTTSGQQSVQPPNTIEEEQEGKKGSIEERTPTAPTTDFQFTAFYAAYPIHKAKGDALKAWSKLTPEEHALCLPAIIAQVKACHFRGSDGRDFVPYPASWLNARRWEDEVGPATANGPVIHKLPEATGFLTAEKRSA